MNLNERYGTPKPLHVVTPLNLPDDEHTRSRGQKWAARKLEAQTRELAQMPPSSGRNSQLNNIAYSCGRLLPGGWLDEAHTRAALLDAAIASGLASEDGLHACEATISSGLDSGRSDPRDPPISDPDPAPATFDTPDGVNLHTGEIQPEHTTWWPKDISGLLNGDDDGEPPPAALQRQDGQHLLYAGKINALIGESESGKSWIALLATAQTLQSGRHVTYLDFEDTAPGVLDRLRLLGVTHSDLQRLAYISPLDAYTAQAQHDLTTHLTQHQPALIAFDGINAAMTLLGLNLLDNMDYTSFSLTVLRPLARTGATVVTVDHVTKSKEGRGAYAIGAQAKRADIDGCALMVEVERPFGRGMTGRLKLTVSKDRPGHVRANSSAGKNAGTVVLTSTDHNITGLIEAPDLRPAEQREPFRPTHIMQEVSHYLEQVGDAGASRSAIEREVPRKAVHVRIAIDALIEDGYVASRIGERAAVLCTTIQPYREPTSGPRPTPSLPRPTPSRDGVPHAQTTPSPVPPLYRGTGTGSAEPVPDGDDEKEAWWQK